jgi:pimeloyl-ACP methyl ester carboxylesterase
MRALLAWLGAAALLSFGLPASAQEPAKTHLIYLHGRIVQEQQSARPTHPEWGPYELEAILQAFRTRGFAVTGEIRPKANTVSQSADHVVEQVRGLLAKGVPPARIAVVGASMGASITLLASVRLQNPELRFVVLGACMSKNVEALVAEHGKGPAGRFLAFIETSDELSQPCPAWSAAAGGRNLDVREIVLQTGLHHGFLYRPLPEWVEPTVKFASR